MRCPRRGVVLVLAFWLALCRLVAAAPHEQAQEATRAAVVSAPAAPKPPEVSVPYDAGRPLVRAMRLVETFTDKYVLQDEMRTIELYPISGNAYATTLLMAYFPKERLLVEADVYTPPDPMSPRVPYFPYAQNLVDNIQTRNLKVDRVLPLHGRMVPFDDLVEAGKRPVPVAMGPPT